MALVALSLLEIAHEVSLAQKSPIVQQVQLLAGLEGSLAVSAGETRQVEYDVATLESLH